MLLLVRMVTRVDPEAKGEESNAEDEKSGSMDVDKVPRRERIRRILFDYILVDFPSR